MQQRSSTSTGKVNNSSTLSSATAYTGSPKKTNRMFSSNTFLCIAFLGIFGIWILLLCHTFSIHPLQLVKSLYQHRSDEGYILHDLDHHIAALPSYSLDKSSYYDILPGYLHQKSVLPGYYDQITLQTYPRFFPLGQLLTSWHSDDVSKHAWRKSVAHPLFGKQNELKLALSKDPSSQESISQQQEKYTTNGLFRLNYQNETELILAYQLRDKELPYVLYNIPELDQAADNEFSFGSLIHAFGNTPRMVERSDSNHFMYYTAKDSFNIISKRFPGWKPPQEDVLLTFPSFVLEAELAENHNNVAKGLVDKESKHLGKYKGSGDIEIVGNRSLHYLIISASEGDRTKWIKHALPFFKAEESLFMREPDMYRGINCRFGMKGVIAAAHYDGRTNYIAMVRGRKRYVLLPPRECQNLELYPRGHPSARHSAVDWTDLNELERYPALFNASATEVVLTRGEVLYLPSFWFHYIISQDASIQCNARSGEATEGKQDIEQCGFSKRGNGGDSNKQTRRKREIDDKEEQESENKHAKDIAPEEATNSEATGDNMIEIRKKQRKRRGGKRSKRDRIEWNMQS